MNVTDEMVHAAWDVLSEEYVALAAYVKDYVVEGMTPDARRAGLAALRAEDERLWAVHMAFVRRAIEAALGAS